MQAVMACEVVKFHFHSFLIRKLDGREWSASRTVYFTPGERTPLTELWKGPRVGLGALQKGKFSSHWQESKHDDSVVQPVA
jgi:hypothetical protein